MKNTIFETPHKTIGHTNWRLLVFESDEYWFTHGKPERFTRYQWYDTSTRTWKDDTTHPRYDSNDGMYAGLPKGVRTLFFEHQTAVEYYLHAEESKPYDLVPTEAGPQYTFLTAPDQQLCMF